MDKDNQYAISNAKAWYESIVEMVEKLELSKKPPHEVWQEAHNFAFSKGMDEDEAEKYADKAEENQPNEDDTSEEINESILSVQVRSGWYTPGEEGDKRPAEYELLLSTGGPNLRIYGYLSEYGEPTSAQLEWQDWGTLWTEYNPDKDGVRVIDEDILLTFARQFYFGE